MLSSQQPAASRPVFTLLDVGAETDCLVPGVAPWSLASVETDLVQEDPAQRTDGPGHHHLPQRHYSWDAEAVERTTSSLFMFYRCLENSGPVFCLDCPGLFANNLISSSMVPRQIETK